MRNFKIDFVFILTAVTLSSVAAYAQLNCKDGAVIRGKEGKKLYCAKITANGGEIKHGEYLSWYENGKPYEVLNYKDGNRDGKYERFDTNGKPWEVSNYKDGNRDGKYEKFYSNGKPYEVSNYKDGNLDGKYEWFYENGKLWGVTNYKDGKLDGKYEWFYENGKPWVVTNYKEDKLAGKYEKFYSNGKPWEVLNYKDGNLDGKHEKFYDNGNRDFIKEYRMDVLLEEAVYKYTDTHTTLLAITKKDGNGNLICIDNPMLNSNFPSDTCGPLNEIQVEKHGKVEDTSLKAIPNGTPSNLSHQTPSDLSRQTPKTPVATPSAPVQ